MPKSCRAEGSYAIFSSGVGGEKCRDSSGSVGNSSVNGAEAQVDAMSCRGVTGEIGDDGPVLLDESDTMVPEAAT